jgi:histidinol-phosphate aminotransferase
MYIEKGDKILLITPTYDNFRLTCESQGGQIVSFEYKQDFSLNIALLKETIREKTPALIYICNPNNPTVNIISNDIILDIINEFRATLFLIDEAYYEFSGQTMSPYVKNYDNLFISRTFSKAFGLANFRIGYLLSQKANIDQISIIRNAKNVTSFAQIAAIVALSDLDYMRKYVSEVNYAKTQFKNEISRLNGIINVFESSGNFLLLEFDSKESKETIYNILYNNGIYVRNLTHSDLLIKCLRITIGTISQMEKVKTLMAKFCGYK